MREKNLNKPEKMTAKQKHRGKILDFLGDPENEFPTRQAYAKMLGISSATLYEHFSPAEFQEIENEAYEIRKKNSVRQRSSVLKAIMEEAKKGNVSAANLFFERTEGKVKDVKDINMKGDLQVNINVSGVRK